MSVEERLFPLPKDIIFRCLVPFLDSEFWGNIIKGLLGLREYFNSINSHGLRVEGWRQYYVYTRYDTLRLDFLKIENDLYDVFVKYIQWQEACYFEPLKKIQGRSVLFLKCRLICFYKKAIYFNDIEEYLDNLLLLDDEYEINLINNALCYFIIPGARSYVNAEVEILIHSDKYRFANLLKLVKNLRGSFKKLIMTEYGRYIFSQLMMSDKGLELLGYKWVDNTLEKC